MRFALIVMATATVLSGCIARTAGSVAGAAVGAGADAAQLGVESAGAVVGAATPDSAAHDHHDDGPRPFDETRDATADVDAALASAKITGKKLLLVLGGNWCHDSRGLAEKFEKRDLAHVISENYELVWVDVGHRDRNLHVPVRFGVPEIYGTPTVLILSPEGDLINRDTAHDWRTADSKPYRETLAYFSHFARESE